MLRARTFKTALLVGASFFIAGCGESPTAPQTDVQESYGLLGILDPILDGSGSGSGDDVDVLRRSRRLAHDEVVTRTISPWGGIIALPESGLTVVFPLGAVRSNTRITVTAPAGDLVGYYFAPHGIRFRQSVTVVQDMTKTEGLNLGGLSAVYFDGDLEPHVMVLERLTLFLLRTLGIFQIDHFSGYVIATN